MPPSVNDCRVMVVDDDIVIRQAVTTLFNRFGYPAVQADGSTDAIDLVRQTPYDLVVSDLDMPVLDGYQLACRIKQGSPRTRVVIMTGSGLPQAADFINCREVDGWLFKPFSIQAISNVMTALGLPNAFIAGLPPRRVTVG
jgi:CheY-like chemotaxis protein